MKKSLCLLAGMASLFLACSDSGTSDANGSGTQTFSVSGSVVVDTENQTFTTVFPSEEELCVNNDDLSYSWKKVNFGPDSSFAKYEFVGDTLVVYKYYPSEDYTSSEGVMYVGGKAGNINGSWKSTLCSYDSGDEESTCYKACPKNKKEKDTPSEEEIKSMTEEEIMEYMQSMMEGMSDYCLDEKEMAEWPETVLKISGNSITITEKYKGEQEKLFDDYTNSEYMTAFLGSVMSGRLYLPSMGSLFEEDSSDVKDMLESFESADVTVASQTKNSLALKYKGETLSINFKKVNVSAETGALAMDVAFGNKTCSLTEESGEVTKATCKAEYSEFYSKDDDEDADGNKIIYAEYYHKSNENTFEECVDGLIDSLYAKMSPSKGGDDDSDACEALSEEYTECILDNGDCQSLGMRYIQQCSNYSGLAKKSSANTAKARAIKNARKLTRSLMRGAK